MSVPGSPIPRSDHGEISPWRELLLFGIALLLCLGGILWWVSSQLGSGNLRTSIVARDSSNFVGSRTCSECHPGEAAQHSRSGHAQTLRPPARALAEWLEGRSAGDPDYPEARWSYDRSDGRLFAERVEGNSSRRDRLELEFAFGSGTHATTFVSLTDPNPEHPQALEHRLSFFASNSRIDVTPGQLACTDLPGRSPLGRALNEFETRKCFECHSTRLSSRGPSTLELASLIPNVSCERCHGPGREHVETARRGEEVTSLVMPFGPGRSTSEAQVRMCGHCHRLPEFVPQRDRYPENPILVRFQSVGLMESRCYKESQGKLSCVTCHNPHARTSHDQARYEAACLACHQGPKQVACSIAEVTGCVGCHMPRRDSGQEMQFADHWIRRRP
ncbi:multiheme c-type cytochrome [Singulisphaera sp. Ch08]|uniref:Multiheme c-type cytochrome n=1 Tax=Singulisphaera sp. Ch08 TaxID=3120278 RepID=A0AAU7CRZ4_9BACT